MVVYYQLSVPVEGLVWAVILKEEKMSKVKLIVCEGYGNQGKPRIGGTERVIDLNLEVPDTHDIMGIVRTDFDKESDGSFRASDQLTPAIRYERINDLVGKILTLVDATFTDKDQRKAMRDLFMQICWDWYTGQSDALTESWRLDKFPNYKNAFELK